MYVCDRYYCEWMCVCVLCYLLVTDFYVFYLISWHGRVELGKLFCHITSPLSNTVSLSLSNSLCPSLLLFPSLTPPTQLYILVTQSYSLSHSLFLSHFLRYYFYLLYSLGDQTIARHHHKRTENAPSTCACTSINIMCSRI